MITIDLLDGNGLRWAQELVTKHHYLHQPVHNKAMPMAYRIRVAGMTAGCLIFGRPQTRRWAGFFGDLLDRERGWAPFWSWEIIDLARVYFLPDFQQGGRYFSPNYLPGFLDRKGVWRSSLTSDAIKMALDTIVLDYLTSRPVVFTALPYELKFCISRCQRFQILPGKQIGPVAPLHRGVIYRAAGFKFFRVNKKKMETWRIPLRPLTADEDAQVREASRVDRRANDKRARQAHPQLALGI